MSEEYCNTFNIKGQSLNFISKKNNQGKNSENPSIESFAFSKENRSIKVVQKIGDKSYYEDDEENIENIPFYIKNIKGNKIII